MQYLRPKENTSLGNGIILTYSTEEIIEDSTTKIKIPYQVSYMEYIDGSLAHCSPIMFTFSPNKITDEIRQKQTKFVDIKHQCIRVGEALNENLRNFLLRYFEINKIMERESIYEFDFIKLRKALSDILKKDEKLKRIETLNNSVNRKYFTTTFYSFIEDRNIYTHGHLHIRINDKAVIINYVNKSDKKPASCVINEEIIQSYLDTYIFLNETLEKMISSLNV